MKIFNIFKYISTIFNLFYFISTILIPWIGCSKCCTGFKFHTCIHLCSINLQNIQQISIYFNYFQSILLHFNHIDPMDRLQQVTHLFQVAHLHPIVQHQCTKDIYISTFFVIFQNISTIINFFRN